MAIGVSKINEIFDRIYLTTYMISVILLIVVETVGKRHTDNHPDRSEIASGVRTSNVTHLLGTGQHLARAD